MLDEYQMQIVTCKQNLLVIAGPGAGKTTTILGKVNYLLKDNKPEDILLLSFTNKSVQDIKERFQNNINVYTFHKLAVDILKYNNINFKICKENLLDYIIDEYFYTLNQKEKELIMCYLQIPSFKKEYYESFVKLIKSFIYLYKTNNHNINTLRKIVNNYHDKLVIKHILNIYKLYEEEKRSTNTLDFDDLIIMATEVLKIKYNYYPFKYIIIDEFQDTSQIRLNLIKEIYRHNKSIVTAVGDDAQSIYHFSGCDLNIFLNFSKYFDNSKILYLKNTYRNSMELVHITEGFIEKNPLQIKKQMHSLIHEKTPIEIISYLNPSKALTKLLNKLMAQKVMILIRNKKDIYKYLSNDIILGNNKLTYKTKEIPLLTIHSSKGLECDNVIILNVADEIFGIPNKLENHPILNYLNDNNDIYPYAEERRCFFVALTRSKNKTYLLVPFQNPSPFVKELKTLIP